MKTFVFAVAALALTGCASQQARIGSIAATPFNDLNLTRTEIPVVLQDARLKPYFAPAEPSCAALSVQLVTLDELLGPDIDVPEVKPESGDAAREMVGNAAIGAVQKAIEGAIPFRGWLRKVSGAERHSKDLQAAVLAGNIRRGFLKGVMMSLSCGDTEAGNARYAEAE